MKKFLFLLPIFLLFVGCTTYHSEQVEDIATENLEAQVTQEESVDFLKEQIIDSSQKTEDREVEIVFSSLDMDDSKSIHEVVAEMNEGNDGEAYYVYDDKHYAKRIKESERKEYLSKILLGGYISTEILTYFSEHYPGVYSDVEIKDDAKEIVFYANKDKYDSSDFGIYIITIMVGYSILDNIQAYELIPVGERGYIVTIIDNQTEEVILRE